MASYTTQTSDKSKKTAIILLLCGGLGLHLLYVGKIKAGIIRMLIGLVLWMGLFATIESGDSIIGAILSWIVLWMIFNLPDLIKLLLGKFTDNIGNYLRA